jgi:CRISPR system Cascade subunit CasC
MTAARCYVDVHIVQTVPPANLNSDDTGSPKQALYGGTRRLRVSSQAWKRATRLRFAQLLDDTALATRTRHIRGLLARRLAERGGLDERAAARVATAVLADLKIKPGRTGGDTAYLLFFGRRQLEKLVDQVVPRLGELVELGPRELTTAVRGISARDALGTGHPIEVALFGRMVADIPRLQVDAATQVAHALSTHAVETEFDYFTAIDDDQNTGEEAGAALIGTVEFSSATLYRYATVGLHQLRDNLDGDLEATVEALRVFLTAFSVSIPTGHQSSFAHHTAPDLVTVAIRTDQPVNLVSAFENPVRTSHHGLVTESIVRLAEELRAVEDLWGLGPVHVASTYRSGDGALPATTVEILGASLPLRRVITDVLAAARAQLAR